MRTGPDALSEEPDLRRLRPGMWVKAATVVVKKIEEDLEGAMGKEGDRLMYISWAIIRGKDILFRKTIRPGRRY